MADGFIVRKGGVAVERTTAPSINFVSKTDTEIVVTFTNNDAAEAEVYYGITSTLTDTVTLAATATSSNITFSGLDDDTAFTISAYALVTDPTSKKIKSEIVTSTITTDEFVITFTAATGGTTQEYDSGGARFRSHTFTSNGTFTVTTVGDNVDDRNKVDYLIIAGGGSGGSGSNGGGGGAGGYRTTFGDQGGLGTLDPKMTVTASTFGVTVGAGGAGVLGGQGNKGANSQIAFSQTIISEGGGLGSSFATSPNFVGGGPGGSGGGGGGRNSEPGGAGTSNQGFAGGAAISGSTILAGGGGGGAGQVGITGSSSKCGDGGEGLGSTIRNGSVERRAGGGGGSNSNGSPALGQGKDGGSNGVLIAQTSAAGVANSGGGTGGSGNSGGIGSSGNGGSGIVVIRYEIAPSV